MASDPGCYCARAGLGFACLASSGELCQMTGMLPVPCQSSEFLLRVSPQPDGTFEATCREASWKADRLVQHGRPTVGHGRTMLAAMINAMMNGQVQDYTETRVS